ncbi:MAG: hypothetical protein KatS3mg131_2381 [Candidatus Tectimicrobiota bacterium]|nr:MAG: hypothetical protein KatS3mg131_2381 [Candidatus Tectomicrobia bacterium]
MARLSFWLIPAAQERAFFEALIARLAHQYEAPIFVPHVTVYASESTPEDDAAAILAQALAGMPPLHLRVTGIGYSKAFTQTLFVRFAPCAALEALSARLRARLARPSPYVLQPHLSLLYKHLPAEEKRRLAATLTLPGPTVRFDTAAAIAAAAETRTRQDVERWQLVCTYPLPGPA